MIVVFKQQTGGKGKDKGVPQKDDLKLKNRHLKTYSRSGWSKTNRIGKVDTKVTGGEYGKLRSGQTVDQSA